MTVDIGGVPSTDFFPEDWSSSPTDPMPERDGRNVRACGDIFVQMNGERHARRPQRVPNLLLCAPDTVEELTNSVVVAYCVPSYEMLDALVVRTLYERSEEDRAWSSKEAISEKHQPS